MRKAIIIITAVIVELASLAGCIGKTPEPGTKITLAVYHWPGSAAIYAAQEKGYFRDEGLEVAMSSFSVGRLALEATLAGKADIATVADAPIARAALDGKAVSVIATISTNDRAFRIIARKDRGISSGRDLKGKKIGFVSGTGNEFFLNAYLLISAINPKNVKLVNIPADAGMEALLKGDLDALSTSIPYTIVLLEKMGGNALSLEDPGIYRLTWNLAAAPDYVKNNPEIINKMLAAVIRANNYIEKNQADARSISAKYIGTDSPGYEKEWSDFYLTAVLDQSLILTLEDQARWMLGKEKEANSSKKVPNFLNFVYTAGLKSVRPGSVNIGGK